MLTLLNDRDASISKTAAAASWTLALMSVRIAVIGGFFPF